MTSKALNTTRQQLTRILATAALALATVFAFTPTTSRAAQTAEETAAATEELCVNSQMILQGGILFIAQAGSPAEAEAALVTLAEQLQAVDKFAYEVMYGPLLQFLYVNMQAIHDDPAGSLETLKPQVAAACRIVLKNSI